MTIIEIDGNGRQGSRTVTYRGAESGIGLRMEIAVSGSIAPGVFDLLRALVSCFSPWLLHSF